jgi:hypothetical protein
LQAITNTNIDAMPTSNDDERFDYRGDEPSYVGEPEYNESTAIEDSDVDDSSFSTEEL